MGSLGLWRLARAQPDWIEALLKRRLRDPYWQERGTLSSNPMGASGLIRLAEVALQVRGMAGEHRVDGARRALGHTSGGGAQFFAMWVVGCDKP